MIFENFKKDIIQKCDSLEKFYRKNKKKFTEINYTTNNIKQSY